jgi:hypothetical protein
VHDTAIDKGGFIFKYFVKQLLPYLGFRLLCLKINMKVVKIINKSNRVEEEKIYFLKREYCILMRE